jgi:hypothetical protein
MIDASGVDEEHVGDDVEGGDGRGQDRSFPPGQQSWRVRRRNALGDHRLAEDVVGATRLPAGSTTAKVAVDRAAFGLRGSTRRPRHGGGPRPISRVSRTRLAPSKGHEAPGDDRFRDEIPRISAEHGRRRTSEQQLQLDELLIARRPPDGLLSHGLIMAAAHNGVVLRRGLVDVARDLRW